MHEREHRVLVTQPLPDDLLAPLARIATVVVHRGAPLAPAALAQAAADCDGLLCMLTERIDAALLAACPRLTVVSTMSVGVDHVDVAALTERGIPLGHTPGVLTETTADLAFALLLAAARRVAEGDRYVRAGHWTPAHRWSPDMLLGAEVNGATLGIVGLGAIGRAVACRAQGFGMRVLGYNRTACQVPGVTAVSLPRLLAGSDFVTVHVALCDATRGLLDAAAIAAMKPTAVLVNTARGGIVDEAALADALANGRLAAAGLDVFEAEPMAPGNPLARLDNVVLTPHIGSASVSARRRMAGLAVANLMAGLNGEPMPHCVNPAVWQ